MKHIRIGKDISLQWTITTDGAAIPLEGRDLTLEMKSPIGKVIILPYRLEGNVLNITYYGYEQNVVGEYSLTLWENKGKPGQNVVDAIRAFKLVRTSPEEEDFEGGDLQVECVDLGTANLDIIAGGGATTPGDSPDIAQINSTLQEHSERIAENASEIERVSNVVDSHEERLGTIDATLSSHTASINSNSNTIANHATQIGNVTEKIETTNRELSELKDKVDANTGIVTGDLSQIKTQLDDHEERLVYTESDLLKVREEYNSIISELVKSIAHTQKAFVVETNDSEGYMFIDNVKKTIPANSIKAFLFNKSFFSSNMDNKGISSFRFFVTNTSGITTMRYMFGECSSLTSLDVSNFDTSEVTHMGWMFYRCSSITSLDVSNFDTHTATNLSHLFESCSSLTSLDLSSFDTHAVLYMDYMFKSCSSLTSLDLSSFDTHAVTNMDSMFQNCPSLTNLLLGPNFFKTSAVTIIDFSYCPKWTNETVVTSLVTNCYDRAAAGLNTLTIKLHANTKAALTDEQKATITSKGYTIA